MSMAEDLLDRSLSSPFGLGIQQPEEFTSSHSVRPQPINRRPGNEIPLSLKGPKLPPLRNLPSSGLPSGSALSHLLARNSSQESLGDQGTTLRKRERSLEDNLGPVRKKSNSPQMTSNEMRTSLSPSSQHSYSRLPPRPSSSSSSKSQSSSPKVASFSSSNPSSPFYPPRSILSESDLREYLDDFGRGDWARTKRFWSPNVTCSVPGVPMLCSPQGIADFYGRLDNLRFKLELTCCFFDPEKTKVAAEITTTVFCVGKGESKTERGGLLMKEGEQMDRFSFVHYDLDENKQIVSMRLASRH